MRKIQNHNLAQLLMQLKFTPQKNRRSQLEAAEKLFAIIDKDKEYPFEFICFRITTHRPKGNIEWESIKGDQLAEDMAIFISKLSNQIAEFSDQQGQKVYSIDELAESQNVSTKTIHRWRKRGLMARKFIFEDGVKRFGFLRSAVDEFLEKNPRLAKNAKSFVRLSEVQKQSIIKKARTLVAKDSMSRYQIIDRIAAKTDRAHETVRYTILNYEKKNPDKLIFNEPPGAMSPADSAELYRLLKQGIGIDELMDRFGRSKSSIYRIINRRKAKEILSHKIEYIDSDEFLAADAADTILKKRLKKTKITFTETDTPFKLSGDSLPQYLQALKETPLLNREREIELFRRYNFLKYIAYENRVGMKAANAGGRQLKKIEDALAEAEIIKKMVIEANLRLVVSIAKKHSPTGDILQDLISEGNFSLMRAVEKFDYNRGFRFATYASWAIAKDFARKIPAEAARQGKTQSGSMTDVQQDMRAAAASAGVEAIEQARRSLVQVIRDNLDEREQHVIINHFGLVGTLIRKNKKTLQQIGDDLGVSRERVRQIELGALQKLRHALSIEEFELLTR